MKKVETGIAILKDGKLWGNKYEDSHFTVNEYVDNPKKVKLCLDNPEGGNFVKKPEDITHKNDPDIEKLNQGTVVHVRRTTIIEIIK